MGTNIPVEFDVEAIRIRLRRAKRQLGSLKRSIDTYWDRKPFEVKGEFNPNFTKYSCRLELHNPIPIEWSARFGEAIHNIRSALDHTIVQLTVSHMGHTLDDTAFPIFSDPGRFQKEGLPLVRGVAPEVQGLIKSLQPFHATRPQETILWYIHQASSLERQRSIRLLTVQSASRSHLEVTPPARNITFTVLDGPKEDGGVLATVEATESITEVEVVFEPALFTADEFSWQIDPDATVVHEKALSEATEIVERLLAFVG